ncbi:hypothetical protein [Algoriphagus resistens]|uniref:hypothetical protein n=1 Tax=Algoriphagus resistens TaxID=1750590 RepID=UPI000716949D|nr:hypothetical protein [Algoriphagus resistens]
MGVIGDIREMIWPLLEKRDLAKPKILKANDIKVSEDNLKDVLRVIIDDYRSENERSKSIESKSSLFIGMISVAISIILGATTIIIKELYFSWSALVLIIWLFILTVYLTRAIWFSLKALERKNYFIVSVSDYLSPSSGGDYYRQLIVNIYEKISRNSVIVNTKVDNMTMAQEYFKRAIIVILVYFGFAITYYMINMVFKVKYLIPVNLGSDYLHKFLVNAWSIGGLWIVGLIGLALSIKANFAKK